MGSENKEDKRKVQSGGGGAKEGSNWAQCRAGYKSISVSPEAVKNRADLGNGC